MNGWVCMTIDGFFVSFLSISLAAIFLALVIGTRGSELKKFAKTVSKEAGPLHSSKKKQWERVKRNTEIADAAIAARAKRQGFGSRVL